MKSLAEERLFQKLDQAPKLTPAIVTEVFGCNESDVPSYLKRYNHRTRLCVFMFRYLDSINSHLSSYADLHLAFGLEEWFCQEVFLTYLQYKKDDGARIIIRTDQGFPADGNIELIREQLDRIRQTGTIPDIQYILPDPTERADTPYPPQDPNQLPIPFP